MAIEEHVKLINEGVDVWNYWREENPYELPDLRMVDFNMTHLGLGDISRPSLEGINFHQTWLNDAILRRARLSGAEI